MIKIRLTTLIILAVLSTSSYADDGQSWRAHYLANAGVMIARGDTKILFDPFFRNDYGQYDLMPREMEAALFAGVPPWDGIDAIFISHHHGDHFDPAVVMRFLDRWPSVKLYAPQQAVAALLALEEGVASESLLDRVHGLTLERDSAAAHLDIDGLQIEAVRIAHGGWPDRHVDVENIVFRVTLDNATTVMHLGDADAGREHYAPHISYWQARVTDLALVPVWLLLTDKGRYVLDEHVDAEHAIGVHVYKSVPDNAEDRPPKFEGLDIFTRPGETRHIE
jgi:L-ascorbate metabolism protein UlaG (beta-lactamase superfamily)